MHYSYWLNKGAGLIAWHIDDGGAYMRKYCIHFEPFINSFKNKFIGIDLNFCSELLAPEEIVKILDETFDEMSVNNLNGLKTSLCQKFGLKDVKLSTYKTSIKWFKDGDYHKYSRKKQNAG